MDLNLQGKVAVISGASRGLGRAFALGLAAEGCNLTLMARGATALDNTVSEIKRMPSDVIGVIGDVTNAADSERCLQEAITTFGRIDILINNAGGGGAGDDDDSWQQAFDVNVIAAVRLSRLVAPLMRSSGGGSIIHIASIWGREAGGSPGYNAMKAAMISHAKSMALRLAPDNIRFNSVAPGSIMFEGGGWWHRQQQDPQGTAAVERSIAMGRFGKPEEVADLVVYLASPRSSWITGACINVDGGQTRSNI